MTRTSVSPSSRMILAASSGWSVSTTALETVLSRSCSLEPWATSRPTCITPTWVHICSTSESRWLETSTVVPPSASDSTNERLRGCPGDRARWSARRGRAGLVRAAGCWRSPTAVACPGSRPGSACRPRPPARRGRGRHRSGSGPCVGQWSDRHPRGARGCSARQVRVEGRALDQRSHSGQHAPDLGGHRSPRSCTDPSVGATSPSSIRIVVVLPGPVGTEEAVDRAARDREVERVDRDVVAESLVRLVVSTASSTISGPGRRRACREAPRRRRSARRR